jgi:hypothetical protein
MSSFLLITDRILPRPRVSPSLRKSPCLYWSLIRTCEEIGFMLFFVIPAKAGIQIYQEVTKTLDSGFHRSDGWNRVSSQALTGHFLY